MRVPQSWRLQGQNYRLVGRACPHCGSKTLTSYRICPKCHPSAHEPVPDMEHHTGGKRWQDSRDHIPPMFLLLGTERPLPVPLPLLQAKERA